MEQGIDFSDFMKVDIRVGEVVEAKEFPEARRPAYKLWIDFGEDLGVKKTSAQITELYTLEELVGRQVIAVVNFPPKQIATFMSEVLVLGVHTSEGVALLGSAHTLPNGARIS